MSRSVRFSIIDYLNALPLNMAFKDGLFGEDAQLFFDYPSQCADNLATDRADVGLISSIEYQRIPDLVVAPEICIASKREVKTVLILTRKDLCDVETVALDRFSRSSVALLRILLHRRYGKRPRFLTMMPEAEKMLACADAALIIGDAALRLPQGDWQVMDLAREWHRETGLPFVFAFWAMRQDLPTRKIAGMLLKAKLYGLEQLRVRIDDIRKRWRLSEQEIIDYFTKNIHFDLESAERESLDRFFAYAADAGLIETVKTIRFA